MMTHNEKQQKNQSTPIDFGSGITLHEYFPSTLCI